MTATAISRGALCDDLTPPTLPVFHFRRSNLFSPVWTYLKRCFHDPSRPLPRPIQPGQAIGPGRQRSGNLKEANRDGRRIPAVCGTARTDPLTPCPLTPSVSIESERSARACPCRMFFTRTISSPHCCEATFAPKRRHAAGDGKHHLPIQYRWIDSARCILVPEVSTVRPLKDVTNARGCALTGPTASSVRQMRNDDQRRQWHTEAAQDR